MPGEAYVPYEELRRTEFFHDFGLPNGIVHTAGAILSVEDSAVSYLSLNRGDEMEMFSPSEIRPISILIPHLKRALAISRELRFSDHVQEAWKRAPVGLVLLVGGQIERVNDRALQMLQAADGLGSRDGRFVIEDLVPPLDAVCGKPLLVRRPSGLRPYVISAIRLPDQRFMSRLPSVLVLINDPEQQDRSLENRLAAVYRLTRAEARLAALLIRGGGLTAAANELGISRHTAKAQLCSIFSKTDTRTQAELVRVALNSLRWI